MWWLTAYMYMLAWNSGYCIKVDERKWLLETFVLLNEPGGTVRYQEVRVPCCQDLANAAQKFW